MKTKCECRRARPSDHRGVIFFVDSFKLHINNKAEPRKTLYIIYISLSVDVFLGLISFKLLYGDHNVSPGDHKPNKKHLPGAARPLDTNSARRLRHVTVVPFTTRSVEGPSTWAGSSDAHVLPAAGEGHMNIMKQQRVPYWVPWPGAIPAAEHIPQHSAPSCESPVLL